MKKYLDYINKIKDILDEIIDTQADKLDQTIDLMFETFTQGNSIYVFGATHAGMMAEEMYGRAGGLMITNPIFNPTLMLNTFPITVTSDMERLPGFGNILINNLRPNPGDLVILHSVSGRNSVSIDMAIQAKELGMKVVTVTSYDYGRNITSRHPSGKMLAEFADISIDNCGVYGDGCIPMGEQGIKAGATSTMAGCGIANILTVGFAQKCEEAGIEPPLFESGNKDGEQDRTLRLIQKYYSQIHYL